MTNERECDCKCGYYRKNGVVIAAQVLSIVAFIVSGIVGLWPLVNFILQCLVFIIYQILWCTRVHKSVFWVLVVASLGCAGYNFYLGYVYSILFDGIYVFSILCYLGGALWIIAAICDLVFVLKKSDNEAPVADASEEVAVAVAFPAKEDV